MGSINPYYSGSMPARVYTLYYAIEKNDKIRDQSGNLLIAWRNIYRAQVARKMAGPGPRDSKDALKAEAEVKARLRVKEKQIQKEMGYKGRWLGLTALSYIPVWLSNVGALSRLCGVTEESMGTTILPDSSGIVFDPAFTSEGLFWFTDLTIADPTWTLPLVAWGFLLTSVSQISRRRNSEPGLLQKFINLLAVAFGPWLIISEVYSGIVLAIMASTSVGILRRSALDMIFGKTRSIQPAKPRSAVLKPQFLVEQTPPRQRMG